MFDGPVLCNIGNICEGAVPERFERAVQQLLANISDLNTDPEASRILTLEFKFTPTPDRKAAIVAFQIKTKLPGDQMVAGSIFISRGAAYTEDPRQAALFAKEAPASPEKQ